MSLTHLRPSWRFLVTVLLLLALPLQAAELARMVVCPPAVVGQGHEAGHVQGHAQGHEQMHDLALHDAHDAHDHHGDHDALGDHPHDAAQDPGHAHQGSGCCKACLAGCGGWVVTAAIDWPAPGWTPARFPRLTLASVPEPLSRGLERPPRTLGA